jgi:hypothetical protein
VNFIKTFPVEYNMHYTIGNILTETPWRDLLPQHSGGMNKAGPRSYSIQTTSDIVLKRQAYTKSEEQSTAEHNKTISYMRNTLPAKSVSYFLQPAAIKADQSR